MYPQRHEVTFHQRWPLNGHHLKIVTNINRLQCLSPLVAHQHRYSRIRREWTLFRPRFQLLPVYSWEYQGECHHGATQFKNGLSNGITILVDRKSKCQINFLIGIQSFQREYIFIPSSIKCIPLTSFSSIFLSRF